MSDELGQLPIAALQWAVEAGPKEVEDLARILRDVNEGGPLERDAITGLPLVPADESTRQAVIVRVLQGRSYWLPFDARLGVAVGNPPDNCPRCGGRSADCPIGGPNWRLCAHAR